ncbi:hypothetical protein MASSI9I_20465 [Massilia sp. 9I]|nr:hypothetical protein MASSI9I_20465 [Massilia sp. 9I]
MLTVLSAVVNNDASLDLLEDEWGGNSTPQSDTVTANCRTSSQR